MKILTLNTWQERGPWRERWELIFKGLQAFKPDIIGFQEVFNKEWAEEVRKRSGYATLVFSPVPSGLMLLSRFEVLEHDSLTLKCKSPTETYLRYVLFAKFKIGGSELSVFNTHLSWQLDEGAVREKQVEEVIACIRQKTDRNETVVMGDFNAPPHTREIKKMAEANFEDAYRSRHPGDHGFTWSYDNDYARKSAHPMPDRRIDYLFTRYAGKLLSPLRSVEIVLQQPSGSVWASDHYGVLVEWGS